MDTGTYAPAPGISQLLVQVQGEERDALMAYAVARGHGVEIADFAASDRLDDSGACAHLVKWYRQRRASISGLVSLHGAFRDILPGTSDSKVAAAARERVAQCLDVAQEVGASCVVFHTGIDALNADPDYVRQWAERQARFWEDVMAGRETTLLLENAGEGSPAATAAAVDALRQVRAGVCLDLAHAHARSLPLGASAQHLQGAPPEEWIIALAGRIRCLHLSDNDGRSDQHLVPGRGTMDWPALLGAVERAGLRLPAVIEVAGVEGAQATEEYLRSLSGGGS
jgi:sugar phosphate isomerase/epimerase